MCVENKIFPFFSEHSEDAGLCSIKNREQAERQYIWSSTSAV